MWPAMLRPCSATETGACATRRTTAIWCACSTFRRCETPCATTGLPATSTPAPWRWRRGASKGWCATTATCGCWWACTLEAEEIAAIERGEALREQVERRLARLPLAPPDAEAGDALELLAWMIGGGHLDVKVAVPCNADGVPVPDGAIFHEKAGIVEDGAGDRIAWNGSLNETPAGWQRNWESVHVYASWEDPARVEIEEENFSRLWANRSPRLEVLDVPSAVRQESRSRSWTTGRSCAAWCSSAACTAWTRTRWRWNSPSCPCGCTPSRSARP